MDRRSQAEGLHRGYRTGNGYALRTEVGTEPHGENEAVQTFGEFLVQSNSLAVLTPAQLEASPKKGVGYRPASGESKNVTILISPPGKKRADE